MLTIAFLIDSVPFSKAVRDGLTSLGGSESACLGLARALQARGHKVHVFATQLAADAVGVDAHGVLFHPWDEFRPMNQFIEWDVVCGLRTSAMFQFPVYARLRLLWNQDLLTPGHGNAVMGIAWNVDHLVYVSEYHRAQWEQIETNLAPLGWVTQNGYDPAHVPADVVKDPRRIIHVSRPERGLAPILAMWPRLKAQHPDAELRICRYESMYDGEGSNVRAICDAFDAQVDKMAADVGGLTSIGSLNKPDLYRAIAEAAVMWYPGIAAFAETSCIAAIEAQACGTPFIGSARGALPETVPSGVLFPGDAMTPAYQDASIAAVSDALDGCARGSFAYRQQQRQGRQHVQNYAYAAIAATWEAQIQAWFAERYAAHRPAILRELLHEDDHTAALIVARELDDQAAVAECDAVLAGLSQGPEDYAAHAIQDPLDELERAGGRMEAMVPYFAGCRRVLDVACGNGAAAIAIARTHPEITIVGVDFAPLNIEHARIGAEKAGVADRVSFVVASIWDMRAQRPDPEGVAWLATQAPFDGLFVGEFVEHVADCQQFIDWLETALVDGGRVVYTCPSGPFVELLPRGKPAQKTHVHCFKHDDIHAVFGPKADCQSEYLLVGRTARGSPVGYWVTHYTKQPNRPAGPRPYADRIQRTRPMQRLSVGLLAKDAEGTIGKCLSSVYWVADEIVIGDTGSSDLTKAIAAGFGPHVKILDLDPIDQQPEGFAGARNQVLAACTGDWFLWIDCDEQLIQPVQLHGYLDTTLYEGYVVRQRHLYLDGPPTVDVPVRLFRNTGKVRFYGCVHEQPQNGDPNADIFPTLQPYDLSVAHFGYLTEEEREEKRVQRNLPLLVKDQTVFPTRLLGKVLLIREAVLQGDSARAHGDETLARTRYAHGLRIFLEHFDDPAHQYHKIARPWYEAALRQLGIGWEHEIAIAGKEGGLHGAQAAPERIWVRDAGEFGRILAFKTQSIMNAMTPARFITDPEALRPVTVPEPDPMEAAVAG